MTEMKNEMKNEMKEAPKRVAKYATLGEEPVVGQSKKAWVLPIDEYEIVDPKYYFITTGEATIKINILINALSTGLKQARKLKKLLEKTKGESDYLETCWEDGKLLVKKKEARKKKPKPEAKPEAKPDVKADVK
jgi:hypothetical protein